MFTGMAINPGNTGINEAICVTGWARQQWIALKGPEGIDNSPQTFFVSVDSPMKFLHGGIGGSVMQDKNANFTNIIVKLDYAYQTDLGPGLLSAGAQLDLVNIKRIKDLDPIDPGDPALTADIKTDLTADAGLGLVYRVPDKYYVGIAMDQILGSLEKKLFYKLKRVLYINGGYDWAIPGHPNFELLPSAMIRSDFASNSIDVTALLMYNKKYWGGLAYRHTGFASLLVGLTIKGAKVGISYDLGVGPIAKFQSGSVEFMASYCFRIQTEKFRKSYKNTRFL